MRQGGAWIDSKAPGYVSSSDDSETLRLEHFCPFAHIGGGVFDQDWRLIGMISYIQERFCFALRIEFVLEILNDWRYEYF